MKHTNERMIFLRNMVFGVEDGLVSTVGFLSGIAAGGVAQGTLIMTGLVLIFVEAISMAIGSFLSEDSVEEAQHESKAVPRSIEAALVMFFSYLIAGFIPLVPYFFAFNPSVIGVSIGLSLVALLILGWISASVFKAPIGRSIVRMVVLGGLAIAAGIAIGRITKV